MLGLRFSKIDPQQRVGCEVSHTPFRKRPLSLLKGDIGGYMSDVDPWEGCPLCKYHQTVRVTIDLAFHQMTDRGRATCCVAVRPSICPRCGFECLDAEAEARLDEAVRQEYNKLPPAWLREPLGSPCCGARGKPRFRMKP